MSLADRVLRPATKMRLRLRPQRVQPKRFLFPGACYIKSPVNPVISKALRMVVLAAAYFFAGKLGLMLAHVHASVAPIWPATGLALAALLVWDISFWPAIFIGAFLVNVTVPLDVSFTWRVIQAMGIACGNTLEAVAGAWLVGRFANGCKAFLRVNNVFRYLFLGGMLSTAISATLGTLSLLACGLLQKQLYGTAWLTWWMGDMVGAVLVAPFLIIWAAEANVAFWNQRNG